MLETGELILETQLILEAKFWRANSGELILETRFWRANSGDPILDPRWSPRYHASDGGLSLHQAKNTVEYIIGNNIYYGENCQLFIAKPCN